MPTAYSKLSKEYLARRNAARKELYGSDPRYRSQAQRWSRDSYRRKNGVVLRDCSVNLLTLRQFGNVRRVLLGKRSEGGRGVRMVRCFTSTEMAEFLGGYSIQNFYRWLARGLMPRPVFTVSEEGRPDIEVYLEQEARMIGNVMLEHQRQKSYLTAKDVATVRSFFNAVNVVRAKYGVTPDMAWKEATGYEEPDETSEDQT